MSDTLDDLIKKLESQDYDYFLNKMLDQLPDDIDKREGSIVFDAIAPCAMVQAERSMDIINYLKQSHIETASGEFLDYFASDKGEVREPATYAKVTASIMDENNNIVTSVEVGDQFASVGADTIMYSVIAQNSDGTYMLQAEEIGSSANLYIGRILPVTPNDSVNIATIKEVSVPARDEESDEELRNRLTSPSSYIAYGGNVTDYQEMVEKNIKDVGAIQIYPSWQGGGTVKLVILDNSFNRASQALQDEVKQTIDPSSDSGMGYGLAPIGHQVTVATPDLLDVTVNVDVVSDNKIDKGVLNKSIEANVKTYFETLKRNWGKRDNNRYSMTIYRSQLMAVILQTNHVVNAKLPLLNGQEKDIVMTFNGDKSQLPNLKDVVIND